VLTTLLLATINGHKQTEIQKELAGLPLELCMLPEACPVFPGWEVCSYWRVARRVGGDFYDFIPLITAPDRLEQWGVVIADVADKGVPAALYMALSRTLMRTVAINRVSPAATLTRVNQLILADTQSSQFVTMFYAVWEPDTGRVRYAVGGHNLPLWAGADGAVRSLVGRGAALGVFDDAQYEEYEIEMTPGDVLLLYTDGVPDAINADDEDFGMDRTSAVVQQMRPESAQHIVDAIARSVQAHVGQREAFDDLTMVVLKRAS
jgi:sigma-B regulation protein RsbU (phosphoserine phosphatase)